MPEPALVRETVARLLARGPSASVWAGGNTLLALGGLAERFPGVAEAWAIIGDAVGRHDLGFRFTRLARGLFDQWIRAGRWRRIDCGVPAAPQSVVRFLAWTRALGFEPEARLERACADGHDMIICVRFAEVG
jgi:hypothetical protein